MSKKDLQKDIRKNGGYILSDSTLNLQHLLPKAYELIRCYRLHSGGIQSSIRECFTAEPTWDNQYYGRAELILDPGKHYNESADYLWNEDIFQFFTDIAPKGYYFGSSEGGGACIGWFKYEESEDGEV